MLLINPLSENLTVESFNTRKTLAVNIKTLACSYLLFPVSHFDIPDIKKCNFHFEWAWEIKKMISYHLKGLHKIAYCKTKSNFSQFFFSHWLLYECFFSFVINALVNFEKFIRLIDKNGENLKILIEIFCQKLIVSNVISAFLDHLKPKIFFTGQPWRLFKKVWIRPWTSWFIYLLKSKSFFSSSTIHFVSLFKVSKCLNSWLRA